MSTSDRLLSTALHGTAIRYAAEKRNLAFLTADKGSAVGVDRSK
jgi:hypothetical protein